MGSSTKPTSSPCLWLLMASGSVDSKRIDPADVQDGWPKFEEIRELMGVDPNTTLQPVRVRFNGRAATMFVDEDGMRKRLPGNAKASALLGAPVVGPAAIWMR